MALTPYPAKTPVVGSDQLVNQPHWSQWLNALRAAVNGTPGNAMPVAFADLPRPVTGMVMVVTDSTVNTWGANITIGGGLITVAAFYNGTHWTVIGK
jgi:hypothetical protein